MFFVFIAQLIRMVFFIWLTFAFGLGAVAVFRRERQDRGRLKRGEPVAPRPDYFSFKAGVLYSVLFLLSAIQVRWWSVVFGPGHGRPYFGYTVASPPEFVSHPRLCLAYFIFKRHIASGTPLSDKDLRLILATTRPPDAHDVITDEGIDEKMNVLWDRVVDNPDYADRVKPILFEMIQRDDDVVSRKAAGDLRLMWKDPTVLAGLETIKATHDTDDVRWAIRSIKDKLSGR